MCWEPPGASRQPQAAIEGSGRGCRRRVTPERDGAVHMRVGGGGVCRAVRGCGGGGGAHRRLGAAPVARGAVCRHVRLRRLRGGSARLRGDSAQLWGTEVVRNSGFEDGGWWN